MTTVIWNDGRLMADSRITYMARSPENTVEHSYYEDNAHKIYEPDFIYVAGSKVLALATSGDARVLQEIKYADTVRFFDGEATDKRVHIDDNEFYVQFKEPRQGLLPGGATIIAVTADFVYGISVGENGTMICTNYPLYMPLAIGSGVTLMGDDFGKYSPRVSMALAFEQDKASGGPVWAWTYGNTGTAIISVPKKVSSIQKKISRICNLPRLVLNMGILATKLKK